MMNILKIILCCTIICSTVLCDSRPSEIYCLRQTATLRSAGSLEGLGNGLDSKTPAVNRYCDILASFKRLNEFLWEWNFKIDPLSHRRKFLEAQGKKTGRIFRSIDAIVSSIRKNMPLFKDIVSQDACRRIEKAVELLTRRQKVTKRRAPNEPAANRCITSVIQEISKSRKAWLDVRLSYELKQPRIYYRQGMWYVREQRYRAIARWHTSVLTYTYFRYNTLWEAFRAVDHQLDSEIQERNWLLACVELIQRIRDEKSAEAGPIKSEIDSMLAKLRRIKVEDKRLARILLRGAKGLLDTDRMKQAKGYLHIIQDLFLDRIKEIEQIIDKLQTSRLTMLREEADKKDKYMKQQVFKILHSLNQSSVKLPLRIIEEDFLEGAGFKYLNEPDLMGFVPALRLVCNLLKDKTPSPEDFEPLKRLFTLMRDRILLSELTNRFMVDFRDEWVKNYADAGELEHSQRAAFESVFSRYCREHRSVAGCPNLYWTAFYQAAFVKPRRTTAKGFKELNPEFIKLSDSIITSLADNIGIRPKGLSILMQDTYDAAHQPELMPAARLIGGVGTRSVEGLILQAA